MHIFQGLDLFVTVVEAGSLTGAAKRLGVPRSTVSRRLRRLEEELGTSLMERTTRSMQLTEAGRLFYARGQELVRQARGIAEEVRQIDQEPRGPLVIATQTGMGRPFTADFLKRFMQRFPHVQLRSIQTDKGLADLIDEVDILIAEGPIKDTNWIATLISPADHMALASPAYLEEMGHPPSLEALQEHRCLAHVANAHSAPRWPLLEGGYVSVESWFASNDFETVRQAALSGLGIAVLPLSVSSQDLMGGDLIPVLPEFIGLSSKLYALFPPHRRQSPKVRALLALINEMVEETHAELGLSALD